MEQLWQYRSVYWQFRPENEPEQRARDLDSVLNKLGKQRWEAVGITYFADHLIVLLKRPREDEEEDLG